jgi:hypothetical protein
VENGQVWSLEPTGSDSAGPISPQGERVVWNSANVWRLFEHLTQVVNLDIECANGIGGELAIPQDKAIFPLVQRASLVSIITLQSSLYS